jgi:hypothetical protein
MAYNDQTEYPTAWVRITSVTDTEQTVFATGTHQRISHIVISGSSANEEIIFREITGGAVVCAVNLGANRPFVIERGWLTTTNGLEVLTSSAAANLNVTVFYYND